MSDLYQQIMNERGSFERLLERIPGFRGYLDKANRRTADRMLRDYIANQIAARIERLTLIERRLLDNGGLGYMSKTSSVKTKMQTYHDRVKAAAPGYSGFMEAIKVDEEALDRLYRFDEAQIRYADRFDEALTTLENANSKEAIDAAINVLDELAVEANRAFDLREDVLTNLNKDLSA
jgi:hypothetical protein